MPAQRHKCFLCLDTVSTGNLNRPYYKVHLENIHNVSVNADKLLNWIIEQRPTAPNASSSGRSSSTGAAASTLSSVANLMGMKGITITKDTTKATGIPDNLINIKGITVQKVQNDDIQILEDDPIYEAPPSQPQNRQQQQHHIARQSPPVNQRLQPLASSSPIRGGAVGIRGNPIIRPGGPRLPYATARGRVAHIPMVAGRGGPLVAPGGMIRARGGVQNNVMNQNTMLKQQEAAIEKWANSCEHGCRICRRDGKSFTTLIRQNIIKHIETVHNISEKDYKAEFKVQSLITRASNHVCSLCNAKVKRLPNSLSSHMKKHQMTIRQYWMKYVAPQNSPLATFQPRTMQGKGGAVRPVHPAMRGVPSGMRVMRGARGGAHYTAMRRGGGFTPSLKKDNIVIGEVFSVNGGASGNEEDSNQDYYDDEITIDEKNIHLLDPESMASSQASLNDSTSTTMEVDVDPLAMMDSEAEDSKDFIKLEGVPVKGEPPSQEAFEVDLDSIRDNKADVKPFIKQELDIKPDISGSLPIIGDAVSEAEGQQTEEDTEEQPAKKRKIDHEEQEKESDTAEESSSQNHSAIEITPTTDQPTDVEPAATEANTNNKDADGDGDGDGDGNSNAETNNDLLQEEEGENMFEIMSCQGGEDNINDQEPSENDQVDQLAGENDNAIDNYAAQTDIDELNDVLESVGATESNADENVNYDENSAQFVDREDNTNVDEESNVDSDAMPAIMKEFMIDGSEIDHVLQDNIPPPTLDNNTDLPAQNWDTMRCPYENQQCPLYCCHVRALQEVEEGATDWTRPYGPPANGGEPCTCCTNSDD